MLTMRIASLVALAPLWLLTIAGGWYVGHQQGLATGLAQVPTSQAASRTCHTSLFFPGPNGDNNLEALQADGSILVDNQPSGNERVRLLTFCKG
jgi:hypothetical protein